MRSIEDMAKDIEIRERFLRIARTLSRGTGSGKHRAGRQAGTDARRTLNRQRKDQRQAVRYQRLCGSGRKHRYKKG